MVTEYAQHTRRTLVTGGAGFIGSHLVEALRARGAQVRVLDDLSSGKRENLPEDVELIIGSITDPAAVARALEGMEACFHLAAIASVEKARLDWGGTHAVNLTGTVRLLETMVKTGHKMPFIYASSAAIYGDADLSPEHPLRETTLPRPLSAYGADKLGCELHARAGWQVHGIPSTGLRFFNVYGPRQDPHSPYSGVISIFAEKMKRGEPITVHGDGQQARDFIFVGDVVAHLLAAMNRLTEGAPVYNVCTGRLTTVLEMAGALGRVLGKAPDIRFGPPRAGDIRLSLGNPVLAMEELGVIAGVSLEEGLAQTVTLWGKP